MAKRQPDEKKKANKKVRGYQQQSRKKKSQKYFVSSATRKQTKRKVTVTSRTKPHPPMVKRQGHKLNVPLRTTGAELQLPAFPQLQFGWRFISGAIFFLSLAVVFSFSSLDTFEVSTINLQGSQRLSSEAILSQIDMIGKTIINIEPEEIKQKILTNFPSLESAKVSAGLPASINIQVVERDPIIYWQNEGSHLWIDKEGVSFPVRGEAEILLTVMASGDPPEIEKTDPTDNSRGEEDLSISEDPNYPRTSLEFVEGILALSEYLPEETILQYDPQFGLGWQDPRGWLVYFGSDISEIDIKLAEYETISKTMQEKNINPALISLEFLHSPFYRMEP